MATTLSLLYSPLDVRFSSVMAQQQPQLSSSTSGWHWKAPPKSTEHSPWCCIKPCGSISAPWRVPLIMGRFSNRLLATVSHLGFHFSLSKIKHWPAISVCNAPQFFRKASHSFNWFLLFNYTFIHLFYSSFSNFRMLFFLPFCIF